MGAFLSGVRRISSDIFGFGAAVVSDTGGFFEGFEAMVEVGLFAGVAFLGIYVYEVGIWGALKGLLDGVVDIVCLIPPINLLCTSGCDRTIKCSKASPSCFSAGKCAADRVVYGDPRAGGRWECWFNMNKALQGGTSTVCHPWSTADPNFRQHCDSLNVPDQLVRCFGSYPYASYWSQWWYDRPDYRHGLGQP